MTTSGAQKASSADCILPIALKSIANPSVARTEPGSFAWKTNNTSQAAKRPLFRCPPNWRKTCPAPQPPLALPAEDREEGLFAELTARLGSLPGAYLCMKTKSSNDNSNLVSRSGRFTGGPGKGVAGFTESVSFDWRLWPHDIRGSVAHAGMLQKTGLLTKAEHNAITNGLNAISQEIARGEFKWRPE